MNEIFDNLKNLYQKVLDYTVEVNSFVKEENFDKVNEILTQRGNLLQEVDEIRSNSAFLTNEKLELNMLIKKIKDLDDDNINLILNNKLLAQGELIKVNKNKKLISAYKFNKEQVEPKYFDSKE